MTNSVIPSTALLTLLLAVGLFFFIRASAKDRTQVVQLVSAEPETTLFANIQTYFEQRAYRVTAVDTAQSQITFAGLVRPSVFLAIFLTVLAGIGILCLILVLALLFPDWSNAFLALELLAPTAGLFYWKKSARPEQVLLQVKTIQMENQPSQSLLTVTAHRDELAELQRSLHLTPLDNES